MVVGDKPIRQTCIKGRREEKNTKWIENSTTKKGLRLRSAQIPEEIERGRVGAYAALKRNHDRLRVGEKKDIKPTERDDTAMQKRRNERKQRRVNGEWSLW